MSLSPSTPTSPNSKASTSRNIEEEFWNLPEVWTTPQDIEWLTTLSLQNSLGSPTPEAIAAQEAELFLCSQNPWRFLTHWVKTEDAGQREKPFQPFPSDLHLYVLTQYWLEYQWLLIPKSRQMTATWLFSALYLWDSMFNPSRMTFFQNKKEDDAHANIQRALTMHQQLPKWMQDWQPIKAVFCEIYFPRSRSRIRGIPAGAQHYRQYTLTGVMADEMAYTEEMDEVMGAARPALGKQGRFTGISSAQPSYFKQLVYDEV